MSPYGSAVFGIFPRADPIVVRCDYVVVGGGTTGCVVAARLSEQADISVLLLEEGPRDLNPYIHIPGAYYKTAQGPLLKRYEWEPTAEQQRTDKPTMVQARVLGGGSSVNAMIYIRGNPQDYARWEALGADGWGYSNVLPYFLQSEDNNRFCNETHALGGPLGVSDIDDIHPLTRAWLQACQQAGLPYNPDFNSGNQAGCGLYQITARGGRRSSAATAFLKPARKRPNLDIRTGARVTRIIVEKGRAVGVEYFSLGRWFVVRAEREVILSAGAIATPKLMMLSGIGPADALFRHGIKAVADLPGVGQNLQDHVEISLIYQLNGPHSYDKYKKLHWKAAAGLNYLLFGGGPASSNLIEGGAFWWGNKDEAVPDVQFFMVVGAGIEEGVETVPGGNGCTVNLGQVRPRSRGEITLVSANPVDNPRVAPRYFSDPADLDAVTEGTMAALDIMEKPAISRYVAKRQVPPQAMKSREQVRQFCLQTAHAALHPAGTCRIGNDELAVVDSQLRVRAVEGLRVADASVMPTLVSGNPNAVCIMIGERAADFIKARRPAEADLPVRHVPPELTP
ncbi:GMC family oxidoreductase N-terminal domain-containing protein [Mesorhizobium sp.]|uniref:GMC family oxidoreductase n=1 Tax=Mesorhizobium sp. TaxID=1871066 RepID=UPI000FE471F0|nr:GMC family oxidoreductase N-terminal domain-containing protein [Mesorhizobium sp.]RWB35822.1 MAG: alanine-phosphoribitol ligase [Mesorhizobium sp.]RWD43179.1 MAG: alanine-phosphoribitol ligase [Mesorhizobium sp.]